MNVYAAMSELIDSFTDEEIEMEIAFAEGFAYDDQPEEEDQWLEKLHQERDRRCQ